jgi:hypothetical protein
MAERKSDPLAPETINSEQDDDESEQAQSVADEARGSATSPLGLSDTEKVSSEDDDNGVQDLVDHMRQMESSGHIDMDAFRGERNDDDEEGRYGEGAEED